MYFTFLLYGLNSGSDNTLLVTSKVITVNCIATVLNIVFRFLFYSPIVSVLFLAIFFCEPLV